MGGSSSRANEDVIPTGKHSRLPEDNIPYKGPSLQCAFMDIKAIGTTYRGRYLKTDIQSHYEALNAPYGEGLRAVLLKTIPGARKKLTVQHGMERRYYIPFQIVMVKPFNSPAGPQGSAKMSQCSVEFQDFLQPTRDERVTYANEVANLGDFDRQVQENAASGYRLVSFEASSYSKKDNGKDNKETILQMELLFHRSTEPGPAGSRVYHSMIIPVSYASVRQTPISRRRLYALTTDVQPSLNDMMQQGWKIVDTTYLSSSLQGAFRPDSNTLTFNTLWVFEKPAPSVSDHRPRWECTVIKYTHIVKMAMNGTKAATTWNPVILEMGRRGWELACILDTAESKPAGWGASQILLLVFQRPLLM